MYRFELSLPCIHAINLFFFSYYVEADGETIMWYFLASTIIVTVAFIVAYYRLEILRTAGVATVTDAQPQPEEPEPKPQMLVCMYSYFTCV